MKTISRIPFHTHYTPLLPSARITSVALPSEKKVFRRKKSMNMVTTLPTYHLAQIIKILNFYHYDVTKAQVT